MSSLKATQADGYYRPPESYEREAPKRRKKTKVDNVVRFELPFDGFCLNCKSPISRGTRYNATKMQHGSYFTSKIWEFQMKCRLCSALFVIRTDPKNQGFDYVAGIIKHQAKLKEETSAPLTQVEKLEQAELSKRRSSHQQDLEELQEVYRYDADHNATLRSTFRKGRKRQKQQLADGKAKGLAIPLLEATVEDECQIQATVFRSDSKKDWNKVGRVFGSEVKRTTPASSKQKKTPASTTTTSQVVPTSCNERPKRKRVIIPVKGNVSTPASALEALGDYGSDSDE